MPLTPAWTKIREANGIGPTGPRFEFIRDKVRFKVAACGRRSIKTLAAKRELVKALPRIFRMKEHERPPWWSEFPHSYFYGAPTQDQAEAIAWDDLVKLVPPSWIWKVYKGSKPCIKTRFGSELFVLGLDEARRIEGKPWCGMVLDEFPDLKPEAWEENILPVLSDRNAWALILGVPDFRKPNNEKFKELFDKGQLRPGQDGYDPNWKSYTWPSADVLPVDALEMLKASMSPVSFRQEMLASWESAPGRAYPDFVRSVHVDTVEYNPNAPLFIGCDFNRIHHNWGAYQYYDGHYYVLSDLYLLGGTVEAMCNLTKDYFTEHGLSENGQGVLFFGDYSGEQKRAEATDSSWRQIKLTFPKAEYYYTPQPPVADRLEKVNSFILNAADKSHLTVDPSAVNHIADFEKVSRTMAYAGDGGKNGELTHASSAFGYMVWQHQKSLLRTNAPAQPILFC